ncbi:MAG: hypothetical protein P8I03_05900 [Thalassotalea sp.]|nr:hypothetical protein [Thalassotalea sp.]
MMKTFPLFTLLMALVSYKNNANEIVPIQAEEIRFWNHAVTNPEEYKGLLKRAEKYDPIIGTVNDSAQIQITLIKKISNWHQQHSNGLKIHFNSVDLTFGDLEAMFISLFLDNDASLVLSKEKLFQRYSEGIASGLIQKNWFDELISEYGIVNIKLFGEHHENQAIETVLANYQLHINSSMINQHQKIETSITQFDFYRQKNWQEQAVSLDEIKAVKVLGMLITAETVNEKTLRSYMKETYSARVPESYIELAISLNDMVLVVKN